jgi:hypothetical protein
MNNWSEGLWWSLEGVTNLYFWATDIPIYNEELIIGLVMEVPAQISCGRRDRSDCLTTLGLQKLCSG